MGRRRPIGDRHATAIVIWFQIQRFFRGLILFVLGTAILGGIGGYIVALIGPEDGIARKLAEQYHLLPGLEAAKRTAEEAYRGAQKAYERGDVLDLEHAEELIAKVRKVSPRDLKIAADEALILGEHADALRRWQRDLELEARDAATKKDEVQLRELAIAKALQADKVQRSGEAVLKEATKAGTGTLEALRASAVYRHLANDDAGAQQMIDRAKALDAKDPWTLAIEASLRSKQESPALLRQAAESAPDFLEARVKLARVLLDGGETDAAKKELEQALQKAPSHREAKRLLTRINGKKAKAEDEG